MDEWVGGMGVEVVGGDGGGVKGARAFVFVD